MLAIRAAGLFDGRAVVRGRVTVLVADGRIVDVDPSGADPPAGAQPVELAGATLVPGLIDAHVHLVFEPTCADVVDDMRTAGDAALLARARTNAARALAAGITTVRDLGDRRYLLDSLRAGFAATGPEVLWSGPPITPTRGHCWFLGGEADGAAGIRAAVADRADRGVDVVKIMATGGMLTPGFGIAESQYGTAELAGAAQAAHEAGLPVTAHAHGTQGIADSVTAGIDGVEHCTFSTADGVTLDERTVERLAAAGTFVSATEAWSPHGAPFPPAVARRRDGVWHTIAAMHRAGVRLVCSTDAGVAPRKPHDALPHGAILFGGLGFTNVEALASVTSVAAAACAVGDRKGRLAPGYDADLLAVGGDPTHDLRALLDVRAVFRAGKRVPR